MSGEETCNNPGMHPTEGQESNLGAIPTLMKEAIPHFITVSELRIVPGQ
jgi:hypothetical protein